ncbi:hypothetical protein AQUCO_01600393v1 [Aquilegia coerulea]|uniref:FBD domain-containing protein n=1 Tax=Aquilegia coerulea TaxID=218851 RepID=A0A2G5DRF5_AQUCA|nr:hypothetical protein AQUCO_01600393v1 [Aquilegia coerulea]PIA46092.1 hypothetical protein AQUCO_01600393v1 [Aquilegia coerulea]
MSQEEKKKKKKSFFLVCKFVTQSKVMDASGSLDNSKKQKLAEGEHCNGDNEDIISNLPDSILHYILSFLPTKYAVGTSILSQRWKFLWTSIHNFDFCDEHLFCTSSKSVNYRKRKRFFIEFVNNVLYCNDVSKVHKFSLKCRECDPAHFRTWTSSIMRREVQELSISVYKEYPYMYPHCFSTFKSMRVLKIDMDISISITGSVCFPSLKVLRLTSVKFCGGLSLPEVTLRCPILEESVLKCCTWSKIKTFSIYAPTLPMLKIEGGYDDGPTDCVVKIYAERLVSLKLKESLSFEFSLTELSSLVDVSIDIYGTSDRDHHVASVLKGIRSARNLKLCAHSVEILSRPAISAHFLALPRLTHLEVLHGMTTSGKKLIELLSSMPYIEYLCFPSGTHSFLFKGYGRLIGTTPQCFLSHLKLVEIRRFGWLLEEQWFLKFLIKSARVMHKLIIKVTTRDSFSDKRPGEMPEKEIKELQMLARSSNCVVEFS